MSLWQKTYSILLLFLLASFTVQWCKVQPDEFLNEFQQHKPHFERSYPDSIAHYELKLIPRELQVIQAVRQSKLTPQEAQTWLTSKDETYDFMLRISIPELGRTEFLKKELDQMDYEARLKYYAFELKNDISATIDGNHVGITDYHFERDFGIGPHGVFRFSVPRRKKDKELVLVINDKVYGTRSALFVLDVKKMNKLPKLKHIDKWKS